MTILLLLAGACGSPAPPSSPAHPPQVSVQTVPPSTASDPAEVEPPPDPAIVSVTTVHAPLKLAIDGELGEWGSLLPPPPDPPSAKKEKPKAPPKGADEEEPKAPPPSGPNPRNAASHLAFALTGDAALIAAELGEPARDGIWLGIGSSTPEVPPIGDYTRGGGIAEWDCGFKRVWGIEGHYENGEPNPPEVIAACKALIERHAKFTVKHARRFARRFKIDREGVRGVAADDTLYSVEGAKVAWKPGAKGATVEITLPLKAMPRVTEAPLASLRLVARAASSPTPPDFAPGPWVWVTLPEPVTFEPHGELRARAFQTPDGYMNFTPNMSYQPGDPIHVERLHYADGPTSVVADEDTLYEKKASLGDIEIGYLSSYGDSLAILKKGKLVDMAGVYGSPRGIVTRDGELHVISSSELAFVPQIGGRVQPSWSVVVIAPDGSHRDEVVDHKVQIYEWDEGVTNFVNKELDTFGMRGSTHYPPPKGDYVEKAVGLEVTWRWDKSLKMYMAKLRSIPVPRPATKKK
jgi:hypothetical protein